jgi:hypothetical protein
MHENPNITLDVVTAKQCCWFNFVPLKLTILESKRCNAAFRSEIILRVCLRMDLSSLYFNVEETDNTGMICLPSISHGSGSQLNNIALC